MKIHDISPVLEPSLAVFPGDQNFARKIGQDFARGDNLLVSAITTTLHIGAHTDAPNHYDRQGVGIDQRDLNFYLGPCQVVEVKGPAVNLRLTAQNLAQEIRCKRVLIKTMSYPNQQNFNEDFWALSASLVEYLAQKKVRLIGIDTPSVDPANDKTLEAHQKIASNNMAILEGIILDHIPAGMYTLVALPLKIRDGDAAPVRAVLLEHSTGGPIWK